MLDNVMSTDLLKTIARIRRAMPRNSDVMEICDYAEKKLIEPPLTIKQDIRAVAANMDRQFNKTAYMRDYMRKRRAKNNG